MADNTTPHAASDYEVEVRRTIPFHGTLIEQAIDVALAVVPEPARWLDTGCGPGRLAALARSRAPRASFTLADPSEGMLAVARANNPELSPGSFVLAPSHALPEMDRFDVITAVQCHHYYADLAGREAAVRRCRALLREGGALVIFENTRAESDRGHALQRQRYAAWLRGEGRSEAEITAQLGREGTKFFPVRPSEHVALLEKAGFATVEVIWRSHGQVGLVALT